MIKKYGTTAFLMLIGLAFASVGVQSLFTPQEVMSAVDIQLNNPSALNSIRAYYGGVNLFFGLFLLLGSIKFKKEGLLLIMLYCFGFVFGRCLSLALDGPANAFVMQWIVVEFVSGSIALWLYLKEKRQSQTSN